MRRLVRDSVERVLASSIVTSVTKRRLRGQSLILAYHAVIPRGERGSAGERSLFVTQECFAQQLDILCDVAQVVPLADLDRDQDPASSARARVAITFDDAYHGAMTCAVDELQSRDLPATFFVAPGCLGGHVFWWDALSHAAGAMPDSVRARALDEFRGDGESILRWASGAGLDVRTDLPEYAKSATADAVIAASKRPRVTLGSHSWSHANLGGLTGERLAGELHRSREWLVANAPGRYTPHLAYPYGRESPEAREAAAAAGYASGLCIAGGWHVTARAPRFARPRLNVGAGMSLKGFRARLLGSRST